MDVCEILIIIFAVLGFLVIVPRLIIATITMIIRMLRRVEDAILMRAFLHAERMLDVADPQVLRQQHALLIERLLQRQNNVIAQQPRQHQGIVIHYGGNAVPLMEGNNPDHLNEACRDNGPLNAANEGPQRGRGRGRGRPRGGIRGRQGPEHVQEPPQNLLDEAHQERRNPRRQCRN